MVFWIRTALTTMSLLLLGATGTTPAVAQYAGVSSFAATSPRFPCDAFLATADFAQRPAMAILWGTFGDDLTCTARFTERYKDKPHLLEIHFSNETCRRNHNCADGELFGSMSVSEYSKALERSDPAVLSAIRDRIRNIRHSAEAIRNDHTYLVLSAGLEDNYTARAFVVLAGELAKEWPYLIVRSGSKFATYPRESHGLGARCGGTTIVANVDGDRGSRRTEQSFLKRNAGVCLAAFLWRADHQGRPNNRWMPPNQRQFIWTAKDVSEIGAMLFEATH